MASGQSSTATCAMHGVTDTDIAPWKRRVIEGGMVAWGDRPHRGRLDRLAPRVAAKIRAKAQEASQVSRARAAPCRVKREMRHLRLRQSLTADALAELRGPHHYATWTPSHVVSTTH